MCPQNSGKLIPVLGVPVESKTLHGLDSLLSIVQMPAGIPVATLAIGRAGAINSALLAAAILAGSRPGIRRSLEAWRSRQTKEVLANPDPAKPSKAKPSKAKSIARKSTRKKSQ